jgi:hypothetical protein
MRTFAPTIPNKTLPSLRRPLPESNEAVLQKVKVPRKRGKIVGPELQVSMTFSAVTQSIVSKLLGLSSFGRDSEVVAFTYKHMLLEPLPSITLILSATRL